MVQSQVLIPENISNRKTAKRNKSLDTYSTFDNLCCTLGNLKKFLNFSLKLLAYNVHILREIFTWLLDNDI